MPRHVARNCRSAYGGCRAGAAGASRRRCSLRRCCRRVRAPRIAGAAASARLHAAQRAEGLAQIGRRIAHLHRLELLQLAERSLHARRAGRRNAPTTGGPGQDRRRSCGRGRAPSARDARGEQAHLEFSRRKVFCSGASSTGSSWSRRSTRMRVRISLQASAATFCAKRHTPAIQPTKPPPSAGPISAPTAAAAGSGLSKASGSVSARSSISSRRRLRPETSEHRQQAQLLDVAHERTAQGGELAAIVDRQPGLGLLRSRSARPRRCRDLQLLRPARRPARLRRARRPRGCARTPGKAPRAPLAWPSVVSTLDSSAPSLPAARR